MGANPSGVISTLELPGCSAARYARNLFGVSERIPLHGVNARGTGELMEAVYWVLTWACHRKCRHCYDDRFRPYVQ